MTTSHSSMPDDAGVPAPKTPDELIEAAAEYAETVPIDVPLTRVTWNVSKRAKRRAGSIEVHLLNGTLCNPVTITLAWESYRAHGWEEVKSTIRHELIHLWEYDNFGKSTHGARFKRKARELDTEVRCEQFVEPRYTLNCLGCGESAGGRHVRSRSVKAPDIHSRGACECDANLRVTDTETGESWTDWTGFKRANPDASDLSAPYRYTLACRDCGNLVTTRERKSRVVKHPEAYGSDECACDARLEVTDHQTGESWTNYDEMPSSE